ncbi:RL11 Family [Baboon cytomegalovirus]|nr:RL11 Family [Baboon cytomegalovirus]
MINNEYHILHSMYTILLLCKTSSTYASFTNISAHVGDNVTLPDVTTTPPPFKGEWYYFQNGCSSSKHSNNYCKICHILYDIQHIVTSYKLPDYHKQLLTYTCNTTGLHLYDISTYTPSLYKLIHEYDNNKQTTYHYFLNITSPKTTKPTKRTKITTLTQTTTHITTLTYTEHSNKLTPAASNASFSYLQSSPHTRPIVVTVIIVTLLATFSFYMYYRYKQRRML